MRVGDMVYCKKDKCLKGYDEFYKGNEYQVTYIDYVTTRIIVSYGKGQGGFYTVGLGIGSEFNEYFLGVREYRKMKLDKIAISYI
jgi:hypothetical protein